MISSVERVLRAKRGLWSPVVSVVVHRGERALLKDYRPKNLMARALLAPVLVRREREILKRLDGIQGIPRLIGTMEDRALLIEYVEGRTLGKFRPGELPDRVFDELARLVGEMHARRVAHLDLRQKKNILIADGHPFLVDFANAVHVPEGSALSGLFPYLRAIDESGLLKFKNRYFPRRVTAADRALLRRHRRLRRFWIFTPHKLRPKDGVGS
jgi:serine/threonine protein kinase